MFAKLASTALVAVLATVAQAGTVTLHLYDDGGNPAYTQGTVASRDFAGAGNTWTFTKAGESVYATVTGWTIDEPDSLTRTAGEVGRWSGGLGVLEAHRTWSNEHTVDNRSDFDFLEFRFFNLDDTPANVLVKSVTVKAYAVDSKKDADITFSFGDWYSSARTDSNVWAGSTYYNHAIDSLTPSSQFNLFASLTDLRKLDGFKVKTITFETVMVPLPPAALMGLGLLGGVGLIGRMRKRRSA